MELRFAVVEDRLPDAQRLESLLRLAFGGGQLLFYFFSDNQTVTSIILAVMILAAVCILGPYYHWRKQEKENTQE